MAPAATMLFESVLVTTVALLSVKSLRPVDVPGNVLTRGLPAHRPMTDAPTAQASAAPPRVVQPVQADRKDLIGVRTVVVQPAGPSAAATGQAESRWVSSRLDELALVGAGPACVLQLPGMSECIAMVVRDSEGEFTVTDMTGTPPATSSRLRIDAPVRVGDYLIRVGS